MTSTPKTIVFYDSEGTGLPDRSNVPKFTEICFLAVSKEDLLKPYQTPRVQNKINLLFNPGKPLNSSAVQVSGLTYAALVDCPSFQDQVPILMHFLKHLPQPVMLVAHNGRRYDFPLLARYLEDAGVKPSDMDKFSCVDSVLVFQKTIRTRRLRLDELHIEICGGSSSQTKHTAEDDSFKLMDIVRKKDPARFLALGELNAQPLSYYCCTAAFNVMFER